MNLPKGNKRMKKLHQKTALMLIIMLLLSVIPIKFNSVNAASAVTLMRCTFKNSVSIKAGAASVETTANITSDGVVLSPYEDTDDGDIKKITRKNGNILIRISNNKKNDVQGYDNVNFTVKYKDDGYGWFFLRYIEKNGNSGKETEIINLTNTGEEKTHTFVLSDVAFLVQGIQDNSVSPSKFYDFELCTSKIWTWQTEQSSGARAWSKGTVTVSEISVTTDGSESPIDIRAATENVGNIFYGAQTPEINMTYKNKSEQAKSFNAKYTVYKLDKDMNRTVIYEDGTSFSLAANAEKSDILIIPVPEYGLYVLETVLYNSNNSISQRGETEFSLCAANDKLNTHIGASTHFVRDGAAKDGLELLEKGGFGLARESVYWRDYETEPGVYKLSDSSREYLNELSKTNIESLLLLYANNPIYDESAQALSFPPESVLPKFKDYISAVLNEPLIKNNINMIEIWNEPDIMKYWSTDDISNNDEAKGRIYAKVLAAAYDAAKSVSDQYTVGAFGACNLWGPPGTTFVDWTLNYLNGEQKFDNLILHPYMGVNDDVEFGSMGNTSSDARSAQAYRINRMRGLVTGEDVYNFASGTNENIKGEATGNSYNYALNSSVWHSEYGYSSAKPYGGMCTGSDYLQASLLIRGLNQIRQNNFDDKIWIYDLFNDGEQAGEEQHNYGMLNSLIHKTPMSAKYSYLAAANYNRLTSSATKINEIKNQNFSYITCYKGGADGRDTYMLWTAKESSKLYFNFGSNVRYYDLLGNEISKSEITDGDEFMLTREPFYAVTGGAEDNIGIKKIALTDGLRDISGTDLKNRDLSNCKIVVVTDNSGTLGNTDETKVIVAAYRDNRLMSAAINNLDAVKNGIEIQNVINIENIKAFVWKDLNPVYNAYDNKKRGENTE